MHNNTTSKTLITTLGGQAQVVTFALDWLLAQGEPIGEVVVVHLSPQDPRVQKALDQLNAEFADGCYKHTHRPLTFWKAPVSNAGGPLLDIRDAAAAEAAWQTMYSLIADLKQQHRSLHICVAGGRRIVGLMAASAAMLHFDHLDRLWHLYTPNELRKRAFEGALLHAGPQDGIHLIQVPIAPLGAYFPGLQSAARPAGGAPPDAVIRQRVQEMDQIERTRCRTVFERLTSRQAETLRVLASGLTPQEAAERLGISLKTIDTYKTAILAECRIAWSLAGDQRLDYHFLHDHFNGYFQETS